ncbi:hypothetical protein LIA77_06251 [Sarocladium implicatum]|nr:hypothetical protein LIA77_06251 [Sarocladium implicatum]
MSRLAPVEKLPLAARKNIRDAWENAKEGIESDLSSILGQTWTVDVNANQIYAYAEEGYAKECPGSMIAQYIRAAIDRLRSYVDKHGDGGKTEINKACSAHALTIDVNLEHDFLYNGCAVTSDGKLAILFNADRLAVNIDDCLEEDKLSKALNDASTSSGDSSMSYVARSSTEKEWEQEAERTKKTFADILQTEVTLEPNFQQTYDALKAAGGDGNWETNIGNFTRFYFEGLADGLRSQKFDVDDMMREALVEALEKGTIAFRVVEQGKMKKLYNESVFEDGVLYMQTTAERFGTNVGDIAEGLVDLL